MGRFRFFSQVLMSAVHLGQRFTYVAISVIILYNAGEKFALNSYLPLYIGGVAQLGERLARIQEVVGSNPIVSTSIIKACGVFTPRAFLFVDVVPRRRVNEFLSEEFIIRSLPQFATGVLF